MDDKLRRAVGLRLQQDRVHVRMRLDARRNRLQRLRPPDLSAVGGDGGIVGHILRLERADAIRSEEHTSELQSLMRISYAVFCLKKKTNTTQIRTDTIM